MIIMRWMLALLGVALVLEAHGKGLHEALDLNLDDLQSERMVWPRPNVYIGSKHSLTGSYFGVAWNSNQQEQQGASFRHDASDHDGLERWGYMRNDGDSFWQQQFIDPANKLKLHTDMHCIDPENLTHACSFRHHASWILDINGTIHASKRFRKSRAAEALKASFMLYFSGGANQTQPMKIFDTKSSRHKGIGGNAVLVGGEQDEQEALIVVNDPNSHPTNARTVFSERAPLPERQDREGLVPKAPELANIHYLLAHADVDEYWNLAAYIHAILSKSRQQTVHNHYRLEKLASAQRKESVDPFKLEKASRVGVIPLFPNYVSDEHPYQGLLQLVLKLPFSLRVIHCSSEMIRAAGLESVASKEDAIKLNDWVLSSNTEDVVRTRRDNAIVDFDKKFNLTIANGSEWANRPDVYQALHHAVSQVVGCITHYKGSLYVDGRDPNKRGSEGEEESSVLAADGTVLEEGAVLKTGEYELITGMPSRSLFPRGFLWDEGFHQLLVAIWDRELSKKVIKTWFQTSNREGWIPREQTIGAEAQSRVPAKFRVQRPDIANPPTLLLPIEEIISCYGDSVNLSRDNHLDEGEALWVVETFGDLSQWINWFNTTQATPHGKLGQFRWAGASPNHTFASGLDDFPRGVTPTDYDVHVDLMCWMLKGVDTLFRLADLQDLMMRQVLTHLDKLTAQIMENLEELWDPDVAWFCDYGAQRFNSNGTVQIGKTCHKGYVGLFPLALGILDPQDPRLELLLRTIRDEDELWTPYGLRSLSKRDPLYRKGEDYWRGKVWINVNYLVWRGLRFYSTNPRTPDGLKKQMAEAAEDLRVNLVTNVVKQYQESGFLWENYEPDHGHGTGTHPFTGWTGALLPLLVRS